MSGMNDFLELIPEFIEETRDHISSIEADLVEVERILNDRQTPEPEPFNRLFRSAHAVKGGAEFVGLAAIEEIAFSLETLFNFLRNGDITADVELVVAALAAIDRIKAIAADPLALTPGEIEETATNLRDLTDARLAERTRRSAATVMPTADLFDGLGFTVSEYTLERKTRKGNFFVITLRSDEHTAAAGKIVIELSATLSSLGEILDTITASGADEPFVIHFLYHTMLEEEALRLSFPAIPAEDFKKIPRERLEKLFGNRKSPPPAAERRTVKTPRTAPVPAPRSETPAAAAAPVETTPETAGPVTDPAWELCTEFVTFFLEHEQYAVPIFMVHDIKEMLPFSRLPNQPPFVFGVVNLRGNVVPVFDLRRIIGLPARPFDRKTVILILDIGGKITGCVVDAISDVVTLEHQNKQITPLMGRNITADYVRFIGRDKKNGTFLIVLDIEKMLPE